MTFFRSSLSALAAVSLLAVAAFGAPLTRDLGQGLTYFRVAELPRDLPVAVTLGKKACVLDLRYAQGGSAGAAALEDWLKQRAAPRAPIFVLANSETARELRSAILAPSPASGVMTLGPAGTEFQPNIEVGLASADERRAYDALAEGVSLTVLLTDNPDKVRNDEASLSKDRLAEASADAVSDAKKPAPPPVDAVLQRAVHLHRALLALKKL